MASMGKGYTFNFEVPITEFLFLSLVNNKETVYFDIEKTKHK